MREFVPVPIPEIPNLMTPQLAADAKAALESRKAVVENVDGASAAAEKNVLDLKIASLDAYLE